MNALEIREHFLSRAPWVDRENTVDTIKAGDPEREIRSIAVAWYPSIDNLRAAAELGCDMLMPHEPTFWEHAAPETFWRDKGPGIAKSALLEETGMVILRNHDIWDQWPEIGIRDSWARGLGLTHKIDDDGTALRALYAIEPQPLRQFAQYVADKVKVLGEDSVQVMGDPDRIISRPSLGVGCIGPDTQMIEKGSDCLIVCFDGCCYWAGRERFIESGTTVITVEHGTSEMWGLESLAGYLRETFPELTIHYLDRHPRTWTVMAS